MKSLQTEKQFSYKGLLYKLAIFVVTVCVIVYFGQYLCQVLDFAVCFLVGCYLFVLHFSYT